MAQKKKYYAVAVGRIPGIYTRWYGKNGAEQMVRGFAGAVYKGFPTIEAAQQFLEIQAGQKQTAPKGPAKNSAQQDKAPARSGPPAPRKPGQIVMYTDGGALENPGPGGYGVVIDDGGKYEELSRGYRRTTNNRMELMACIVGLSRFKESRSIVLYSDSQYVINGITKGWARNWRIKGWKKSNGQAVLNPDLWEQLLALSERHDVDFRWIRGHTGIPGNERCDQLVKEAASGKHLSIDAVYEQLQHT